MTFVPDIQIETRAAELWQQHRLSPGFDVERLVDDLDLNLVWDAIEDHDEGIILGQLIPAQRLIVLNERHATRLEAKEGRQRRYTIGHEIGHWILHAGAATSESLFRDGRTWCRDGSVNPAERQAEKFSAALLIPRDLLLASLPRAPWLGWAPVYALADRFVVNVTPMRIRLEGLGWMHLGPDGTPRSGPSASPSQPTLFDG
jgi:uncharacterized protein DUF955